MKCSHCGAQLPEAETPRYCIYCGRPLEGPGKDGGLESVLAEIRERFGLDALRDGQRAVAYLADLAPARWAYYDVAEASNGHGYVRTPEENWTGLD